MGTLRVCICATGWPAVARLGSSAGGSKARSCKPHDRTHVATGAAAAFRMRHGLRRRWSPYACAPSPISICHWRPNLPLTVTLWYWPPRRWNKVRPSSVHVFQLVEHAHLYYRTLVYSSDTCLALADLPCNFGEELPASLSRCVRNQDGTLVALQRTSTSVMLLHTFPCKRLDCLLETFMFWQSAKSPCLDRAAHRFGRLHPGGGP